MYPNEQKFSVPCAGNTCNSLGKYFLKILYLNKHGWFCESCKEDLLRNGLIVEEDDLKKDAAVSKAEMAERYMIQNQSDESKFNENCDDTLMTMTPYYVTDRSVDDVRT